MNIVIIYLLIINLVSFVLMGSDKSQARNGGRRIPEKRLFTMAAVGGALGTLVGMRVYRHKTKHMSFVIGIPLLLILNVVMTTYIISQFIFNGKIDG
ncbi:DUF1294 domain-containing protein [Paenibacillus alkaliterrae]|uniref:DUF1294 domain-containing protein n=1 Tax=Paenibacillus alkaliterrae TaxID=320909 RepID=UPI001F46590C|nr:DUF1294 domain-containing protein [Paenibacillus alkaliterrae]MCF2940586.1 DUF1294 domain-containing protein [Paenibacillus alkaliterrae]